MKNIYIQPRRALEKLKYARALAETVYIGGATGYGKTSLVSNYLKARKYIYHSCENDDWTADTLKREILQQKEKSSALDITVVIDDLHRLNDMEINAYLIFLSGREGVWLILIGRSAKPEWLAELFMKGRLTWIEEEDLKLDYKGLIRIFSNEIPGIEINNEEAEKAAAFAEGNPMVFSYMAARSRTKTVSRESWTLTESLQKETLAMFLNYLNTSVFPEIDSDVMDFCMQVSVVDSFDASLAEYITGYAGTAHLMNRLGELSSGILTNEKGIYKFRYQALYALQKRRDRVYGTDKVRQFCYNAGLYYESRGRILEAVHMYEKSGSDRIRNLLIQNASLNPAEGYYYELKKYYLALSDDEIRGNVHLMSGMSMLYSLILEPQKSEYWYQELEKYSHRVKGSARNAAEVQLLYLDIALPQRGIIHLEEIFQKAPVLLFRRGLSLPEFSVTSNLPSLMNGGKDFSEWSRHDKALAASLGQVVVKALGRYGRGLVPIALAESQYEQGGDLTEVVTWISQGQMEAQNGGRMEMEFAAVGLLAGINCLNGRSSEAMEQLNVFRAKASEAKAEKLIPNIDALRCRIFLLTGDVVKAEEWLADAPDERQDFFVMKRMIYLTMVRCCIGRGEYVKAISLLDKLQYYAELYHRAIVLIEVDLLLAIVFYRRSDDKWQEYLHAGMKHASQYHFIPVIASEGTAILPLLKAMPAEAETELDQDWLKRVKNETERVAARYPSYLLDANARRSDFSRKDIDVLALQAKGYSVTQISSTLKMKPETVRYHIKQNYRKLQVSSKSEAVLVARDLGLI